MGVFRVLKMLLFLLVAAVLALLLGFVVQPLWNWLVPGIFGLHVITYWQAVGLLVLSKLLFGGLSPRGGGGGRAWKRRMGERWAGMSEEERERFRAGMRGRRGCGFGRGDAQTGTEATR